MDSKQALKITLNAICVDAALRGESEANLNRVTFWLSELSYGRKYFADKWSHAPQNDIVRTAARIAETVHTAPELVALANS
jgi:hypothetical protein